MFINTQVPPTLLAMAKRLGIPADFGNVLHDIASLTPPSTLPISVMLRMFDCSIPSLGVSVELPGLSMMRGGKVANFLIGPDGMMALVAHDYEDYGTLLPQIGEWTYNRDMVTAWSSETFHGRWVGRVLALALGKELAPAD